ncbi:hypothetical protein GF326_08400 [Candidatus Bathyarchaeota archaeon]|nr:hypothetical protein [Candidatus Bathyarchaeota archaeon]
MKQYQLFSDTPVSLKTTALVVILITIVTSINVYLNPPELQPEEPEMYFYEYIESISWNNWTRFDIDCWYPEGMTVEEMPVDGEFTYHNGALYGYSDPNNLNGRYILLWKPESYFENWEEALQYLMDVTGWQVTYVPEDIESVFTMYPSWQDHEYSISAVNGTDYRRDEMVGIFLAQHCDVTNRSIVFFYTNYIDFDSNSYVKNGAIYSAAFRCHPYEGTPLDPIIGYPYENN